MINVHFIKSGEHYKYVSALGHANAGEAGEDLVCAAVSSIMFGICNALNEITKINDIEILENEIIINIKKPNSKTDLILETLRIELETVRETNKRYLRLKETEE